MKTPTIAPSLGRRAILSVSGLSRAGALRLLTIAMGVSLLLPASAQNLIVQTTGYLGHDGGATCGSGGEVIRDDIAAPYTACVSVENTFGAESISNIVLTIPELSYTNAIGTLAAGTSFNVFFENSITGDVEIVSSVTGNPVISGGTMSDTDRLIIDSSVECPNLCFVVSDVNNNIGIDSLYLFNTVTLTSQFVSAIMDPASNGVYCSEALTFETPLPGLPPKALYTVESCRPGDLGNGYLGTIDWEDPVDNPASVPGTFRQSGGAIGSGSGLYLGTTQVLNMVDVDGLEFDDSGTSVVMYAAVRFGGDGNPDVLIQLDTNTGAIVSNAFGAGIDFVQIGPVTSIVAGVTNVLDDIDDMAFNQAGQLYAVANENGAFDVLAEIDKATGIVVTNFPLRDEFGARFEDMEGLSFDPVRDNFYGTSGSAGGATANSIFQISLSGTNVGQIVTDAFGPGVTSTNIPGTGDYEGSDCFLITPDAVSTISGSVFWDPEEDGDLDGGEQRVDGVFVFLFEDLNTNGVIDMADLPVDFIATDLMGEYEFQVAIDKEYIIFLDPRTLPAIACGFTTTNQAQVSYPNLCGVNVVAPDFGVATCSYLGDFVWDDLNQNGIQDPGEPGIPGVSVNVYGIGGALVSNTVTDLTGFYEFPTLISSNYYIEVIPPPNYLFTAPNQGGTNTLDSDILAGTNVSAVVDLTVVPIAPALVYTNITIDAGLFLESDYAVMKDTGPVQAGTSNVIFTYDLVITNLAIRTGTNLVVEDVIPVGLEFVSDDAGGSYNSTNRLWTYTIPTLAAGEGTNIALTVAVTNDMMGAAQNEACILTNSIPETNVLNNCDTVDLAYLGDRVWLDIDTDGIQDPGETEPVPGISVFLLDANSNQLASTVTDTNGNYFFSVPAGTYIVEFVAPSNTQFSASLPGPDNLNSDADPVTGRTDPVMLVAGETNLNVDAGLLPPVTVEKTATQPLLGSGGVTFDYVISVTNSGDVVVNPVVVRDILPTWVQYLGSSEGSGVYNGGSREYSVDLGPLAGFSSTSVTVNVRVTGAAPTADLVNTASVNNVVFDSQTNAFVGDFFFVDDNNNDVFDSGEAPVPNATVNLFNGAMQQIGSTNTDASGLYGFIVPPGTYTVQFVAPGGTTFVAQDVGGDETIDSDANPTNGFATAIALTAGQVNTNVDAAVEVDLDLDKRTSAAVPGNTDVTFDYLITVSNTSALAATTVLVEDTLPVWATYLSDNAGGTYTASNRLFAVDIGPLAGNTASTVVVNVEVNTASPAVDLVNTASVNRAVNAVQTNALIGDLVFHDYNTNNLYDVGVDGVVSGETVNLIATNGAVFATTTTDTNGNYYFVVPPGEYQVEFVAGTGVNFVTPNAGSDTIDSDADIVNGRSPSFTVSEGETNLTVDAGVTTVTDLDKSVSAISSSGGNVQFSYILSVSNASAIPSNPLVLEDPLPDWALYLNDGGAGGVVVGGVYSNDLGVLPAFGSTTVTLLMEVTNAVFTADLTNTASVNRVIFASQTNAIIGDYVWRDGNTDGIQQPAEAGIPGVTVELLGSTSNVLADTLTASDGFYAFIVTPDTYSIRFNAPVGTEFSPQFAAGSNTNNDSNASTLVPTLGITPPVTLVEGETNATIDAGLQTPLDLSKSVNGPYASSSNVTFTYVLTVSNTASIPADPVDITDPLPVWAQYISDDAGGGMAGGNTYTNSLGPLPGNTARTINIEVLVTNPQAASLLVNTGSVNGTVSATQTNALIGDLVFEDVGRDGNQTGDSGMAGVTVELYDATGVTQLGGTVTDGSGNYYFIVPPGDYTVNVVPPPTHAITTNNAVADNLDSDIDPVTGATPLISVAAGETNLTVDGGLFALGAAIRIDKTVTTSGSCPGVELIQSTNGTPVEYCFVVVNTGETRLDSVTITDSNVLAAPIVLPGILEIGQSVTSSVADIMLMDLTNTAFVVGNPVDTNGADIVALPDVTDDDTAEVDVVDPQIQIIKTVYEGNDGGASCPGTDLVVNTNGAPITYCIQVINTGDTPLLGVTVTDALLSYSNSIGGLVLPGVTNNFFIDSNIAGDLTNTASVVGTPSTTNSVPIPNLPPVMDDDDAEVDEVDPSILIQKTVYEGNDAGASCATAGEIVTNVLGTAVTYCLEVTNTGDTWLTNNVITDVQLGIAPIVVDLLAPGQVTNFYIDATMMMDLVNVAMVTGIPSNTNGVPFNIPPVTSTDTAAVEVIGPGIVLQKTVYDGWDNGNSCPGVEDLLVITNSPITYCFNISNTGDVALTNVTLTDTNVTPNIVTNIGTLAASSSTSLYWEVIATSDLINTGRVTGTPPGGVPPVTDTDTSRVDVVNPGIALEKTVYLGNDGGASIPGIEQVSGIPGTLVTYAFQVSNIGDTILTNVVVNDPLLGGPVTLSTTTLPVGGTATGYVETIIVSNQLNTATTTGEPPVGPPVTDTNTASVVELIPAAIGDTVWYDVNQNGDPNDENLFIFGQSNVVVELYSVVGGVTSPAPIQTTMTGTEPPPVNTNLLSTAQGGPVGEMVVITTNSGYYVFNNLPPGQYFVRIDPSTLNSNLTVTTTTNGYLVTVGPGDFFRTADFGFVPVPTSIELRSFTAAQAGANVELRWSTGSELDNMGFNLYRASSANGQRNVVNEIMILGQGTGNGADYAYTDANVPPGHWFYWLEDVEYDLDSELHGPAEVVTVSLEPSDPDDGDVDDGDVIEAAGMVRIETSLPAETDVLVNGTVVPSILVGDGLVAYVATTGSVLTVELSDTPQRMEEVSSAPVGAGQAAIIVANEDGQVSFTSMSFLENYLAIGFETDEIIVLDVTDPAAPKRLTDLSIIQTGSDNGAYIYVDPAEPARVHAAEPRAFIEVER